MRLARVVMAAPALCGACSVCKTIDVFGRIREYVANLDEGEAETERGAVSWLKSAYPACPTELSVRDW